MFLLYFQILFQINYVLSYDYNRIKYENHVLYNVVANNNEQLTLIKNLTDFVTVNFWRYSDALYRPVEFTIGPDENYIFLKSARDVELNFTTLLSNVQSAFNDQTVKTYTRRRLHSFNWDNFFKVDDIYAWFVDLTSEYPTQCQIMKLGKTYEDRDILALRVRLKANPRSSVIMEGGIHGREWLSPAVVTYILHSILTAASGVESELKSIAETYEWYFVPILNPDGYEYSFTRKQMCDEASEAIKRRHGTVYESGLASETIGYHSSGVSTGWVKSRIRVPYVLTIKLRDQGRWGFAIPPSEIKPCCEETMDGMISFLTPRTKEFSKLQELSRSFCCKSDVFIILFCYVLFYIVN